MLTCTFPIVLFMETKNVVVDSRTLQGGGMTKIVRQNC